MKVKWLAWIVAAFSAFSFILAPTMGDRIAMLAPLLNFFLFFRDAMQQSIQSQRRRVAFEKNSCMNSRSQGMYAVCAMQLI